MTRSGVRRGRPFHRVRLLVLSACVVALSCDEGSESEGAPVGRSAALLTSDDGGLDASAPAQSGLDASGVALDDASVLMATRFRGNRARFGEKWPPTRLGA
ncbi:MAG: hypothetical protein OXR73_10040 [Myxococcales bacterium]|nr:hypothetical protein [Myxococcales bacterium]